jgi:hypothetical protein
MSKNSNKTFKSFEEYRGHYYPSASEKQLVRESRPDVYGAIVARKSIEQSKDLLQPKK